MKINYTAITLFVLLLCMEVVSSAPVANNLSDNRWKEACEGKVLGKADATVNYLTQNHSLISQIHHILEAVKHFGPDTKGWEKYESQFSFLEELTKSSSGSGDEVRVEWFRAAQSFLASLGYVGKPAVFENDDKLINFNRVFHMAKMLVCKMEIYYFIQSSEMASENHVNNLLGRFSSSTTSNMLNIPFTVQFLQKFLLSYRRFLCDLVQNQHHHCLSQAS